MTPQERALLVALAAGLRQGVLPEATYAPEDLKPGSIRPGARGRKTNGTSADIYPDVHPVTAARLASSHGRHACEERWYWLSERQLSALIEEGRVVLGNRTVSLERTI